MYEAIVNDSYTKYHSLSDTDDNFVFEFDSGGVYFTINPNSGS